MVAFNIFPHAEAIALEGPNVMTMAGGWVRINAAGSGMLSPESVILSMDLSLAGTSNRNG